MHICVIGNSHIAALKLGWDEISKNFPHIDLRFFGAPSNALKDLTVSGSRLLPGNEKLAKMLQVTSGGDPVVEVGDYDAFLFYGLGFTITPIDSRLSQAVTRAYCHELANRSLNARLTRLIQSIVSVPVYTGHVPLQANIGPIHPASYMSYGVMCEHIRESLIARGVTFIQQPPSTVDLEIRTKALYTKNSARLNVISQDAVPLLHPDEDTKHMNADFGAAYLEEALEIIQGMIAKEQCKADKTGSIPASSEI